MQERVEEEPLPPTGLERLLPLLETLVVDESDPGSVLPSEGELALRFGVSRPTVREGLKVLAGRDLVELRVGRRALVRAPSSETLARYLTVAIRRDPGASLELNEIRLALEVQSASAAATRATKASLTVLGSAIRGMAAAVDRFEQDGSGDDYNQADIEFHEALALASGNRMLALVLTSLEDSLRASFAESFRGHVARGGSLADAFELHRRVYERVAAGDSRGAAAAMRSTLRESARDLRASFARPPHGDLGREDRLPTPE